MMDRQKALRKFGNVSAASEAAERALPVEIVLQFCELVSEAESLAFVTRDSDLQRDACRKIEAFTGILDAEKKRFAAETNEDSANACLAIQCMIRSLLSELNMWLEIRSGEYDEAWNSLIDAQRLAIAAIRAHPCGAVAANRLQHYEAVEENVFPPQVYCSAGFIIEEQICSICSEPYEDCIHIKGDAYMGKFCVAIIKKADLLEGSIVEVPADKRCRVTYFSDSGGRRNRMTWKVEPNIRDSGE